jgi:hypothetical protein
VSAIVARTYLPGDIAVATGDAGFAAAGQPITILDSLPGERVRIKYVHADGSAVTDLIVETRYLVPLTPGARHSDPGTAHAAAANARRRLGESHRRVLAALAQAGERGLTDFELARITGRKQTSYGVRRGELVKAGLVHRTGQTRPSDTQSDSAVWAISPAGLDVWNQIPPSQRPEVGAA